MKWKKDGSLFLGDDGGAVGGFDGAGTYHKNGAYVR